MKIGFLIVVAMIVHHAFADEFHEKAELACSGYSIKVSTYCGCLSDLSPETMEEVSKHNCSSQLEVYKNEKRFKLKPASIKGCYEAYEFEDTVKNFICIEAQYTATNASLFTDSLANFKSRKKCTERPTKNL